MTCGIEKYVRRGPEESNRKLEVGQRIMESVIGDKLFIDPVSSDEASKRGTVKLVKRVLNVESCTTWDHLRGYILRLLGNIIQQEYIRVVDINDNEVGKIDLVEAFRRGFNDALRNNKLNIRLI